MLIQVAFFGHLFPSEDEHSSISIEFIVGKTVKYKKTNVNLRVSENGEEDGVTYFTIKNNT